MRRQPTNRAWLALILTLLVAGCAGSPKEVFLNRTHRENFSLVEDELLNLQVFISTSILVQYESPTGKQSMLLPKWTPGVVTAVGPDWLKVSFREGGAKVPFAADKSGVYDSYYLATEIPGRSGFQLLKDLPQKIIYYEGARYHVISGEKAYLLVDGKALQKLFQKRVPTQSQRVEPDESFFPW